MVHLFCVIGIFYSLDLCNGVRWINIVCPTGNIVLVAGGVFVIYGAGESDIEYIVRDVVLYVLCAQYS